ncbi:MAG: 5'/3'-nucleotidase SurE [Chloroflexota bacterium]
MFRAWRFLVDGRSTASFELDYTLAVRVAADVVRTVLANDLPQGTFLNVNVPHVPEEQFKGIRLTRQGLRVYRDRLDKRTDPRGNDYYWIGGDRPTGVPHEGTDVGAIFAGFASVTPLALDLTAFHAMPLLEEWLWNGPADLESALLPGPAPAPVAEAALP